MTGQSLLQVRDAMSKEVVTLKQNDKLTIANDVMILGRIRHMPVLDDSGEKLVGILSQRDLFRGALARCIRYGKHTQDQVLDMLYVKEVMTRNPVATSPESSLAVAARLMLKRKIGCLPVLDAEKIVGILTEGDFVKLAT